MENDNELRLAVLIDAENAPRTALKEIMAEIAVYGSPTIKRIYGDWTTPSMASWKPLLLEHAITPIQQYSYTTGKNSSDSALIIDAMDLLYSGRVGGFVLVSSDSDFTRLATRLREAGMKVFGMGEKKTPQPFIASCDRFIYIEVIRAAAKAQAQESAEQHKPGKKKGGANQNPKVPKEVVELIADSLEDLADDEGYGMLSEVGTLLLKKQPDFDSRNFGFKKLSSLIQSLGRFEIDKRQTTYYIRDKEK
jgi:hypothetical protein